MVTADFAKGLGVTIVAGLGMLVGFRVQDMLRLRAEVGGATARCGEADCA